MFCLNCGEQLPDGTQFCTKCGAPVTSQSQPTASNTDFNNAGQNGSFGASTQPMNQPAQPQQFGAQPQQFGAQPQQFGDQPQQFGAQQAGYGAPVYGQPVAVKKKPPVVPIVIGVCAAAVVAFLIVLFTVIIPNNSGIRGKLRHKWSYSESGVSVVYDFKKNEISTGGIISFPITWEVTGEDHLKIEISALGQSEEEEFIFTVSPDGKTLTLSPADQPNQKQELKRAD